MIEFNNSTPVTAALIGQETRYGVVVGVRAEAECDGTVWTRPAVEFADGGVFYPSFTEFRPSDGMRGTHYSSYWGE